ncbi:transcriptional regulator family: Fungal Specific TF [Penicillium expansum]|nr:transcriptional regulator family: Fungal Specific TF [Penicillium expansum]
MQTQTSFEPGRVSGLGKSRAAETGTSAAQTPPWLVAGSFPLQRLSKACDGCRTRKIKCDGSQPCQPCEVRRATCHYRVKCRQRQNAAFYANKYRQTDRDGGTQSRDMTIAEGVYATESLSSACPLQLYYGPSSNFFLLQRIHHHLGPPTGKRDTFSVGADEIGTGLDRFKYRGLFFGRSFTGLEGPAALSDPFQNNQIMVKWSLLTSLLPRDLATQFVSRFTGMELPFISFIDGIYVKSSIQAVYEDSRNPVSLPEYIQLVACLALGATMTEHVYWAERLFNQVQELGVALDDAVNLETVQVALIMISYPTYKTFKFLNTNLGRPNAAYLLNGTASRKAIAAGSNSMICYCLGRPNSISEEDITIQLPNDEFIINMAKLTKIIRRSARLVYGSQGRCLVKVWEASQEIQEALDEFEGSLPEQLKFKAHNGSPLCCQSVAHFFLGSGLSSSSTPPAGEAVTSLIIPRG